MVVTKQDSTNTQGEAIGEERRGRKMGVTVLMTLTEHRTARHVTDQSWRGRYLVWLLVLICAEFQPWGAHEDRPNWHLSRIETFNPVVINNLLNVFTLDIFGIIDILNMICTEEGWCRLSQLGVNGRKENRTACDQGKEPFSVTTSTYMGREGTVTQHFWSRGRKLCHVQYGGNWAGTKQDLFCTIYDNCWERPWSSGRWAWNASYWEGNNKGAGILCKVRWGRKLCGRVRVLIRGHKEMLHIPQCWQVWVLIAHLLTWHHVNRATTHNTHYMNDWRQREMPYMYLCRTSLCTQHHIWELDNESL